MKASLVVEVNVDLRFAAEPSLVLQGAGEVDFVVDDAPAGQARLRAGAGLRVAVGEDADVVAGGPQCPGQEAEELGVHVQQAVEVKSDAHGSSGNPSEAELCRSGV